MRLRRVAVLGGGPGGLYAARLLKLAVPSCEVTLYEQGEPDKTFGFGVGLAAGTQRNLDAADPDTFRDIVAVSWRHDMTMRVRGRTARVHNDRLVGVARTELLTVLQRHAEKAGVQLEVGARRSADQLDAEVVIGADGVSSGTREVGDFGARIDVGRGVFVWCGADFALDDAVFTPIDTEHGTFVTHAYPYAADRSTFMIETDERTWRAAGFDVTTAATPSDATDTASLSYLSEVFAEPLRGHPLVGNRTRWTRFRTVRCERWSSGRVVLLGDAAHTAHPSIGSGTKLAMEDATALVEALVSEADRDVAYRRYEQVRRPAVQRMQELARRSQLWWESFPSRMHLPVEQLMVAYMTRAGNVPVDRFAASSPDVVGPALGQYAGTAPVRIPPSTVTSWILDQPLERGGVTFPHRLLGPADRSRLHIGHTREGAPPGALLLAPIDSQPPDPWRADADAVLDRARDLRRGGVDGFWLTGSRDRPSVLTRLDLAERLRREVGGLVAVVGTEQVLGDLAAGLLSGRTDLVAMEQ